MLCQGDLVCEMDMVNSDENESCNGEGAGEFCVDRTKCSDRL